MNHKEQPPFPAELREEMAHRTPEACREIEHVWDLLGHAAPDDVAAPATDAAWEALQQRLRTVPEAAPRRATDRQPRRHGRLVQRILAGVTALVVVLVAGVWLWQQPLAVQVPYGAQQTVTLPDGSVAELNSGSQLTYTRGFQSLPFVQATTRTVTLHGEAFFEVARDGRPFVVETFNTKVEVLGTSFNVKARPDASGGATQVTVATGRVRVTAQHDPAATVVLEAAGATTTVAPTTTTLAVTHTSDLERILVWRQQGFSIVNQSVGHLLAELQRRFNVQIEVEEGVVLTDSVNVFYGRAATAEKVIHDLCLAQRCRYRKTSNGFVLLPDQP